MHMGRQKLGVVELRVPSVSYIRWILRLELPLELTYLPAGDVSRVWKLLTRGQREFES